MMKILDYIFYIYIFYSYFIQSSFATYKMKILTRCSDRIQCGRDTGFVNLGDEGERIGFYSFPDGKFGLGDF